MNNIGFTNETNKIIFRQKKLKKLINFAIDYMKLDNIEFNVIFVNDYKIRSLNKTYRNIDKETDVITFRLEDYEKVMENNINVLGDIYISIDTANSQALEYKHSTFKEISFLIVHGFLHLLGYDHMNEKDEKVMFKLQEEILCAFEGKEQKEKPFNTLKEDFERRNINPKSIMNIFKYSINGIKAYAEDGKSFIVYLFCSFIEILLGFIFNVNGLEWILIIFILGIILAVELLNTGIESACDAITKDYNQFIKIAKDCGSGATFIIFVVAIILNIIIFYPKIIALF